MEKKGDFETRELIKDMKKSLNVEKVEGRVLDDLLTESIQGYNGRIKTYNQLYQQDQLINNLLKYLKAKTSRFSHKESTLFKKVKTRFQYGIANLVCSIFIFMLRASSN